MSAKTYLWAPALPHQETASAVTILSGSSGSGTGSDAFITVGSGDTAEGNFRVVRSASSAGVGGGKCLTSGSSLAGMVGAHPWLPDRLWLVREVPWHWDQEMTAQREGRELGER